MIEIKDLLGNTRYMQEGGKVDDERKSLIRFFTKKTEMPGKRVAIQLGHYKDVALLYTLKSMFIDRENRNGITAARKWFWWYTRTEVVKGG